MVRKKDKDNFGLGKSNTTARGFLKTAIEVEVFSTAASVITSAKK